VDKIKPLETPISITDWNKGIILLSKLIIYKFSKIKSSTFSLKSESLTPIDAGCLTLTWVYPVGIPLVLTTFHAGSSKTNPSERSLSKSCLTAIKTVWLIFNLKAAVFKCLFNLSYNLTCIYIKNLVFNI
jgi:hypothetical protein